MKRIIFSIGLVLLISGLASAQEPLAEIIFGPRDSDSAGTLYAYENSSVAVDVWIRTAPGISIVGIILSLSSNNDYISSRDGVYYDYFPLNTWFSVYIFPSNNDPYNPDYTNQSLQAMCCWPFPICDTGIQTEGEWWKIALFLMTSRTGLPFGYPYCDAFTEGYHPDVRGILLSDCYIGEMDPSTYTVQYACLELIENNCGPYVVGDFNGSGQFNVADIITSFSKLSTGSPEPGMTCECPPGSGNVWGVAMDVNNSCAFNVADIVIAYQKLALGHPELIPCAQCPPTGP